MSLKWKVTMRTALNSLWGHLEREPLASGLRNVDTEDHSHSGVFPSHIRLSFLQLNVGISQFQDTSTVNSNIDIDIDLACKTQKTLDLLSLPGINFSIF